MSQTLASYLTFAVNEPTRKTNSQVKNLTQFHISIQTRLIILNKIRLTKHADEKTTACYYLWHTNCTITEWLYSLLFSEMTSAIICTLPIGRCNIQWSISVFVQGFQLYNECDLPPRVLLLPNKKDRPLIFRPALFLFASLFLLSWPLRMLVYAQTATIQFPFRKLLRSTTHCSPLERCHSIPSLPTPTLKINKIQRENSETMVLQNIGFGKKYRRTDVKSDTDDDLLSIDIRFTELQDHWISKTCLMEVVHVLYLIIRKWWHSS